MTLNTQTLFVLADISFVLAIFFIKIYFLSLKTTFFFLELFFISCSIFSLAIFFLKLWQISWVYTIFFRDI